MQNSGTLSTVALFQRARAALAQLTSQVKDDMESFDFWDVYTQSYAEVFGPMNRWQASRHRSEKNTMAVIKASQAAAQEGIPFPVWCRGNMEFVKDHPAVKKYGFSPSWLGSEKACRRAWAYWGQNRRDVKSKTVDPLARRSQFGAIIQKVLEDEIDAGAVYVSRKAAGLPADMMADAEVRSVEWRAYGTLCGRVDTTSEVKPAREALLAHPSTKVREAVFAAAAASVVGQLFPAHAPAAVVAARSWEDLASALKVHVRPEPVSEGARELEGAFGGFW